MDAPVVSETQRLSRLKPALKMRAGVISSARRFFEAGGFLEVATPVRISAPALELYIDAEPSGEAFLRTSPELHMKRLLAAGYDRIFQVGPCFRRNEQGSLHHPEFTMLEWYRADADYMDILADARDFVVATAKAALGRSWLVLGNTRVELECDWYVRTVSSVFSEMADWDPVADYDPDRFDADLVEKIERRMPLDRPSVLLDFPAGAAALARLKPDDPGVAERWELYIGGVEIANAFSELVDPAEQRERFEDCAEKRRGMGKPVYEIDEEFMAALEHGMPPSAGAALGIDRLAMILCGATSLDGVLPFR